MCASNYESADLDFLHDARLLSHFDNKCVQAIMKVQTWIFLHDARLLPHFDDKLVQRCSGVQTRIFYTMHAYYRILTTDAAREGRGCLQTMPRCESLKIPPVGLTNWVQEIDKA